MRKVLLGVPFVLALMGLLLVGAVSGDTLPEVSFGSDSLYVAEDAGHIDIDVSLNPSSTLTVTVGYATVDGTALAGQDFISASGTLTFTPGITVQTFPLTVVDNALPDDDRSLFVVLTAPQSATLGLYSTLTVTIIDDGDPYVVLLPLVTRRWPPLPYDPTLNAINNPDGGGSYTITWYESPTRLADTYTVQEAKDAAFTSDVVQVCSTSGHSCAVNGRGLATYYYRVRGHNVWGSSNWSNVQSVTTLPPAVPTLHAINNANGGGNYTVDWSDAARASSYVLEEADNVNFASATVVYSGAQSQWSASNRAQGTYYYRVRSVGSTGSSDWSNTQSVAVLPPAAPVLNAINNANGAANYTVSWGAAARATGYQLQQSTSSSFASPVTVYTGSGLSWSAVNRPVGTYYYRVMATGPTGSSAWSHTQSTQVAPPPPPTMPGYNIVCNQIGNAQICASVSNATPAQYSNVTVYGRLLVNGVGQSGLTMNTSWHYKSTVSYCSGVTDANGLAQCTRDISRATEGYQVNVDVAFQSYSARTWFTPQ